MELNFKVVLMFSRQGLVGWLKFCRCGPIYVHTHLNVLHIVLMRSSLLSSEEDTDMNFATFSAVGGPGTHFVTTGGQLPVTKIQQNVANNGTGIPQVMK